MSALITSKNLVFLFIMVAVESFSQEGKLNPVLQYSQAAFDSDSCCWRKLSANKQYLDAANLIVAYLKTDKSTNKHSLNWHAGQMYAMAGSNKLAVAYFKKTYSVFYLWFGGTDAKTWYYYAKGTVAFIDNDKKQLQAIIRKWTKRYPADNNLRVLIRLNVNWGMSYEDAYSGRIR